MDEFIIDLGYSPSVRIGNWYEEACREENAIEEFRRNRKNGKLALQITRKLFSNFFKEVPLSYLKRVFFGTPIQLIATKMNVSNMNHGYRPTLSVVVHESRISKSQQINEQCELTIAPSISPCVRNTFIIKSGDTKNRDGEQLHYGQQFILQCVEAEENPLVMYSSSKLANLTSVIPTSYITLNNRGEENQAVGLCVLSKAGAGTNIPTGLCKWKFYHENPEMRFETEGLPAVSNNDLVIAHVATNRLLAAENVKISTLFGPECMVSAQTYLNIQKKGTWQNCWAVASLQK